MTSHYADVSRAWDIMDIMNNIEVTFESMKLGGIFGPKRGGNNRGLENIAKCLFILFIKLGDKIKEGEMGLACRTHGRDQKCIYIFS